MIHERNYQEVLENLTDFEKKRITSNIARKYCLLECVKENNANVFKVKLTNKTTAQVGQYLLAAKHATKVLEKL